MFFLTFLLSKNKVDDSFENIFFGHNTFHIFHQVVSIILLPIFQVENYQIQPCLWNDIYKWWEYLQSVLSTSKHDKIMSEKVVILKDISRVRSVCKSLKFSLSCFTIVQLEVIAGLEVDTNYRLCILT